MKVKSTYIVSLVLICGLLSSCHNYTCEDFKTGEYVYADSAYADVKISRVLLGEQEFYINDVHTVSGEAIENRNSKKVKKQVGEQTEIMTRDGKRVTDVYTMIWDGPCSYSLVFKSTDSKKDQFHTNYDTIRVSVLGIEDDRFTIRANLGNKFPEADLIKIK